MSALRRIRKVLRGRPTLEGAGVHLKRAFGVQQVPQLDPFLLLDDFHSTNPSDYLKGFPWHPHRGIETITYVLHGRVGHGDSMGNEGVILPGDVQWMTAGSGVIHQEMPKGEADGLMWGFQLWANLPASNKMMDPRYRDVRSDQIPHVTLDSGVVIKIISGVVNGIPGPVQDIVIDPQYLDITIPESTSFRYPVKREHTVLAYVTAGRGYFDQERDCYQFEMEGRSYFDLERDCAMGPEHLVIYDEGDELVISTEQDQVRFLLISGKPIGEPVAWYGPIVMYTQEELRRAFKEYRRGTFLRHGRQ
jgi:redox-sensitive bicupin YhaK (pirin superfamily)